MFAFCLTVILIAYHYCDELDGMVKYVKLLYMEPHQKLLQMYSKFTFEKYGFCGSDMRHKVDDCVQEVILTNFPVAAGKRKSGYRSAGNDE